MKGLTGARGTPLRRLLRNITMTDTCWIWRGSLSSGVPQMRGASGRVMGAHVVAYQLWVGGVQDGEMVVRTCHERRCVRPEHLELSTGVNVVRRGWRPGKLTRAQRDEVRATYAAGGNMAALARGFGVHWQTVHRIATGKTWAWERQDGDDGA